jgi:peptidoglycan/xylan/chitin deacetylase (PgdA/CDA1 family)
MARDEIRSLSDSGHVIGSHSCSHPPAISQCSRQQLLDEWRGSLEILAGITGAPVTTASIPGGFYSRTVAETAAECGIEVLFTSEPTQSVAYLNGCALIGRYSIQQHTPAATAARLAAGEVAATLPQFLLWNAKKPVKAIGGRYWLSFRKKVFAQRPMP